MKKIIGVVVLVVFALSACSTSQNSEQNGIEAATKSPGAEPISPSPTNTAFSTFTPSPIPELPVGLKTPIPVSVEKINTGNVNNLREIARYYGNLPYIAKLTKDRKHLLVRNQANIDIYDFQTKKLKTRIAHYAITTDKFGLQISDDGRFALIDGVWLLDTEADSIELRDVFALAGFKTAPVPLALTALSRDGTKLAVAEFYQRGRFYILDLGTNEVISKSIYGSSPVFSSDGSMIATNLDNQIIVWNISSGTPINKFPLERFNQGVVFSPDSQLIAIKQSSGNIDVWNIVLDENIQIISSDNGQCQNIRKAGSPTFSDDGNLVVFDCNGNVQVFSVTTGNKLYDIHGDVDIPSITFDEKGNINLLVPPYSAGTWGELGALLNDFRFLDDIVIGFQYRDIDRRVNRGCAIPLLHDNASCEDNIVIGADNSFYKYAIRGDKLSLYGLDFSTPLYEIDWSDFSYINVLSPQKELVLYTSPITDYTADTKLVNLRTGEVVKKWELRRPRASLFSEKKNFGVVCLDTAEYGISFRTNKPRMYFIDLTDMRVIYEEKIACIDLAFSHSVENKHIAVAYDTLPVGSQYLKSLLVVMNTEVPNDRLEIDVGCDRSVGALAYSPDDSILAVGCSYGESDGDIHFLSTLDGTEIQFIKGYSGVNDISFSHDGKMLAISFGGGIISIVAVPSFIP